MEQNIGLLLETRAKQYADKTFFIFEDKEISYKELDTGTFRDIVQNYHLTEHLIVIKRYYYGPTNKIGCAGNPSSCDDPGY